MAQNFKGDANELKMIAGGTPPFDLCSASLESFYAEGYTANDFLLMLYDEGRMPFSDRVPRDAFVRFIREALANAPFTGTFESYIFLLNAIFGEGESASVLFEVPAAGKLALTVNASAVIIFEAIVREFSGDSYIDSNLVTHDDDQIVFQGISGIDSEAELRALLAELIPAGIWPDVTLTFFTLSAFIAEDGLGGTDFVLDDLGNQLVFYEVGA